MAETADNAEAVPAFWCDVYFRCERCAKVFWRGTHWRRIEARLAAL